MQKYVAKHSFFDSIYLIILMMLVVGVPLVFTYITRSIFEVNKLLLIRLLTIIMLSFWLVQVCMNHAKSGQRNFSFEFLGIKKTGLEIPLLLWFVTNLLSTFFSQNFRLSLIGSYDRWEGIFTVTNYIILLYFYASFIAKRQHFLLLIGGILFATAVSGVYGVFQAMAEGKDFITWSWDATVRVFASMNSPVHYCAYVAMVVPLGVSQIVYLSERNASATRFTTITLLKWTSLCMIVLIYYNQFLSFSRAAWIGFIAAMTLFYLLVTRSFFQRSQGQFLIDFFATGLALAVLYLLYVFNLIVVGPQLWIPSLLGLMGYIGYVLWQDPDFASQKARSMQLPVFVVVVIGLFFPPTLVVEGWMDFLTKFVLTAGFLYACKTLSFRVVERIVIAVLFVKLPLITISWEAVFFYAVALVGYTLILVQPQCELKYETKVWLIGFLLLFGLVLVIPAQLPRLLQGQQGNQKVVQNVSAKVSSLQHVAITGTDRTSMWKSAFPWIADYWFLGSGLDTIKYMYPLYRRPEYGRLPGSGGHQATPDRLHNEYLNTAATRGLLGLLIYYGGVILGWFLLVLRGYYTHRSDPFAYFLPGILAGVSVYLGQVMFNFGAVVTLFLFYTLMGLGLNCVGGLSDESAEHA